MLTSSLINIIYKKLQTLERKQFWLLHLEEMLFLFYDYYLVVWLDLGNGVKSFAAFSSWLMFPFTYFEPCDCSIHALFKPTSIGVSQKKFNKNIILYNKYGIKLFKKHICICMHMCNSNSNKKIKVERNK